MIEVGEGKGGMKGKFVYIYIYKYNVFLIHFLFKFYHTE